MRVERDAVLNVLTRKSISPVVSMLLGKSLKVL